MPITVLNYRGFQEMPLNYGGQVTDAPATIYSKGGQSTVMMEKRTHTFDESIHSPLTMHGAEHWVNDMYNKLGHVAFEKSEGKNYKVDAYYQSINDLLSQLEKKVQETKEQDKLYDLNLIIKKVNTLRGFAQKLLS